MSHPLRFEELWDSASKQPKGPAFDPANLQGLPEGARRYLQHSIPIGESLRSAVRLRMHGEIKLKDWYPFSAEQARPLLFRCERKSERGGAGCHPFSAETGYRGPHRIRQLSRW